MSNKYTYSVPFTEEELYNDYVNLFMTQKEIALKYKVSQKVIWRAMGKMGIPSRTAAKRNQKGSDNSNWKGGRVLSSYKTKKGHKFLAKTEKRIGYWLVKCDGHPHQNASGYVFEHVKIALEHANRDCLLPHEVVHHINCDPHDNRPENLLICDKEKHRRWHADLEKVINKLVNAGIVTFNEEGGYEYEPS